MICDAKSLSADQRSVIETLLGHSVREGETVSIRTFDSAQVPYSRKLEISDELSRILAEADASRRKVSPEEAEDIVAEAIRSVRPGYRAL